MQRRDVLKATGALGGALVTGAWRPWGDAPAHTSLLIAGSATALPLARSLANAFMVADPDVEAVTDSGSSIAGLIAISRGALDVATMSRDFKRVEDTPLLKNMLFAKDAVAVIVAPENPVRALTTAQALGLVAAHTADWAMVGGNPGPVRICLREPWSASRFTVEDVVLKGDYDVPRSARIFTSSKELIATVRADPAAIGVIPFRDLVPDVFSVEIDKVPLTEATVYSGRHPYSRSYYFVTSLKPTEPARRFLAFVTSAAGRQVIDAAALAVY